MLSLALVVLKRKTAWITATLFSVASLTPCWGSCNRFRMRRPGYSHKLADENTWHQSWDSSTVSRRIDFKLAVLNNAPDFTGTGSHVAYLQDRWPVKWAAADDYVLPMFRRHSWCHCHARGRNYIGDRSFAAAGVCRTKAASIRDTHNLQKTRHFCFLIRLRHPVTLCFRCRV